MGRATGARRKQFTYADRNGHSQDAHARHWLGFTFQAGPVMVKAIGIWGECQVWAASEEEGKRMIRHGLTFGGFNPDDPIQGHWETKVARGRNGQPGAFGVDVTRYGALVSKRQGPNGQPEATWLLPVPSSADPWVRS